ncbi:MAG: NGG1p interacting factor NIF3 [Candidatus Omnitrophota bacterium]
MKLAELYNQAVKLGAQRDPRGKGRITAYADSRVLYGNPEIEVKKILVGIDMEVAELLLAECIREREGLDLVIAHHPEGKAYAALHEVMQLQVDLLRQAGISQKTAQKMLGERMDEVERKVLPQNHTRPVDAARLLDIPFICIHTPADNHVYCFLKKLMEKEKPKTVQDLIDILAQIPEYREAVVAPRMILGNPKRPVGKVMFEMTGGTEGPKEVFDKLYKTGVRTLVSMHLSEEHFKKAKDANLSAVIAGHISSDNLGLNLLLDGLEQKAKYQFQTLECSGFRRIRRN